MVRRVVRSRYNIWTTGSFLPLLAPRPSECCTCISFHTPFCPVHPVSYSLIHSCYPKLPASRPHSINQTSPWQAPASGRQTDQVGKVNDGVAAEACSETKGTRRHLKPPSSPADVIAPMTLCFRNPLTLHSSISVFSHRATL